MSNIRMLTNKCSQGKVKYKNSLKLLKAGWEVVFIFMVLFFLALTGLRRNHENI